MITLLADLHTHTIASGHAYSTIKEMAEAAYKKKLELIAITDHGKGMEGAPYDIYFLNLVSLPREIEGVTVISGIEANIMDMDGRLDVSDKVLSRMEWVIASLHSNVLSPASVDDHTEVYLRIAKNPLIDIIGHPETPAFTFDYDRVIREFGATGKIVEINNYHAFGLGERHADNAREIARLCKKYEVPIAVNSDAHTCYDVGRTLPALLMLEAIDFPQELVLNTSAQKVLAHVKKKQDRLTLGGI